MNKISNLTKASDACLPDYIFESSWEVCNKVGGIYTVLSTRAKTLQSLLPDHIIFIGPDCWGQDESPFFIEDDSLFAEWHEECRKTDLLRFRIGRWKVPGSPVAILVDFMPYYLRKDEIYGNLWKDWGVDSLHAYGDYDEASMFSYAAAKVVESFFHFYLDDTKRVVYQGNEWMTGLGLLYIRKYLPQVATIFTTHATSIGRSIAGNNKPLYDYLFAYNGNQMADELNMQSKHSIERQTAWNVDCFTTVSEITGRECSELLDKTPDVILPNGFEKDFVPKGAVFTRKRREARQTLCSIASQLTGQEYDPDKVLILSTSGRYEFRNKGIDVFIDTMNRLRCDHRLNKTILAFIEVPAWVAAPRELSPGTPVTHWLHNMSEDRILGMMNWLQMYNRAEDRVKVIFIPSYLNGDDGVVNKPYYDLLCGNDLTIYPSYYEPWGYTPLESTAFKVPCITTDLSGFGLWVNSVVGHYGEITDGVKVVHRTDNNYSQVIETITDTVVAFAAMDAAEVKAIRERASRLSDKAQWQHFISHYRTAYKVALDNAAARNR